MLLAVIARGRGVGGGGRVVVWWWGCTTEQGALLFVVSLNNAHTATQPQTEIHSQTHTQAPPQQSLTQHSHIYDD